MYSLNYDLYATIDQARDHPSLFAPYYIVCHLTIYLSFTFIRPLNILLCSSRSNLDV